MNTVNVAHLVPHLVHLIKEQNFQTEKCIETNSIVQTSYLLVNIVLYYIYLYNCHLKISSTGCELN